MAFVAWLSSRHYQAEKHSCSDNSIRVALSYRGAKVTFIEEKNQGKVANSLTLQGKHFFSQMYFFEKETLIISYLMSFQYTIFTDTCIATSYGYLGSRVVVVVVGKKNREKLHTVKT